MLELGKKISPVAQLTEWFISFMFHHPDLKLAKCENLEKSSIDVRYSIGYKWVFTTLMRSNRWEPFLFNNLRSLAGYTRVIKLAMDHRVKLLYLPPHSATVLQTLEIIALTRIKTAWRKILIIHNTQANSQKLLFVSSSITSISTISNRIWRMFHQTGDRWG